MLHAHASEIDVGGPLFFELAVTGNGSCEHALDLLNPQDQFFPSRAIESTGSTAYLSPQSSEVPRCGISNDC
jgi:hypothetical protein